MSLSNLVPQMLLYGFTGSFFTHTIGFPVTMVTLLWYMTALIGSYRNDIDPTAIAAAIIDLNFKAVAPLLLGITLGLIAAWALGYPPLLHWEFWTYGQRLVMPIDRLPNPERADRSDDMVRELVVVYESYFTLYALGVILATVGVYFLIGRFEPEVGRTASLVTGSIALIIGAALAFYILYRWFSNGSVSGRLNAMFAIILTFITASPAVYDLLEASIGNYRQLAFHVVFLIIHIAAAVVHLRFFRNLTSRQLILLRHDPRAVPSITTTAAIVIFWVVQYLVPAGGYLVVGLIQVFLSNTVLTSLDAIVIYFAVVLLILLGVGTLLRFLARGPTSVSVDEASGEESVYDTITSSRASAAPQSQRQRKATKNDEEKPQKRLQQAPAGRATKRSQSPPGHSYEDELSVLAGGRKQDD